MTHTEDRGNSTLTSAARSRWGIIAFVAVIAGAAIVIRSLAPSPLVEAKQPRQSQRRTTQPQKRAPQAQARTPQRQRSAQQGGVKNAAGANIAAVINGEPISRQSIGQQCLVRWGEETLESLVNKQLIAEACQSRGIVISDRDLDAEVESIARKFGMSIDQYLKMLKEEREVSETEYRDDIVWPSIALKRLAADKLQVTQAQLDQEYDSEYGPKVQVRMISLTDSRKADQVLQLAKANPQEFEKLAKLHSEDPTSASAKGLIPPVRRHLGEPAVEQAVFALKPGEVSDVVHAANQYLIFRCERHIPAATISPQYRQQTTARLRERIVERNLRGASGEIFKDLQSKAKIVNVMNDPKLSKQSPNVAAFVNSKQITKQHLVDECILRFGREMVQTEINYRLLNQALKQRKLTVSQDGINAEVARAARTFGYIKQNDETDVKAWVDAVTEQEGVGVKEYVRDAVWPTVALKQLVGNQVTVTQEDLEKGFEANYGPRVELLAIVVGNQRIAQEVWDMARKNPTKEFFGQLAEQYSIEPVSRANFGEIPPIRRYGGQPQIENEAFRLQAGELSGIVAMGDKYIIMRCLGRTKPIVDEITDVKTELEKDIREKKLRLAMADEFDRLRQSAQIDNFLEGTSQTGKTYGPTKSGKIPARPVSSRGKRLSSPTRK
jgi:parvulin-like peptidyl-prolyl isomerase